jgi:hypothetical protein
MKIDVRVPLLDYRGHPLVEGENQNFHDFVALALNNSYGAQTMTPEDKSIAYSITTKMYERNEVDLGETERKFIRQRANLILPPLHAGRITDISEDREHLPILPDEDFNADLDETGLVIKNADLTNVDPEKPITPVKKTDGPTE